MSSATNSKKNKLTAKKNNQLIVNDLQNEPLSLETISNPNNSEDGYSTPIKKSSISTTSDTSSSILTENNESVPELIPGIQQPKKKQKTEEKTCKTNHDGKNTYFYVLIIKINKLFNIIIQNPPMILKWKKSKI